MKFREKILDSGTKLILGKDEKSNDELMKEYKGKSDMIIHTSAPGSPFGVIEAKSPKKQEIITSGAIVAMYSQEWRNNKSDVVVDVFTGKDISKRFWMKPGTWKVRKSSKMKIKKKDIEKAIKKFKK